MLKADVVHGPSSAIDTFDLKAALAFSGGADGSLQHVVVPGGERGEGHAVARRARHDDLGNGLEVVAGQPSLPSGESHALRAELACPVTAATAKHWDLGALRAGCFCSVPVQ